MFTIKPLCVGVMELAVLFLMFLLFLGINSGLVWISAPRLLAKQVLRYNSPTLKYIMDLQHCRCLMASVILRPSIVAYSPDLHSCCVNPQPYITGVGD